MEPNDLRRRAEEKAQGDQFVKLAKFSPEQAAEIYQELHVHQIELEFQNQELQRVQAELSASRERYFDLYNLAPVGYLTLNRQGKILEANLTAAELLDTDRRSLVKRRLSEFIQPEDLPMFHTHWRQLFQTGIVQGWTLRLKLRHKSPPEKSPAVWAKFEGIIASEEDHDPSICRLVMSNVTEEIEAKHAARNSEDRLRFVMETSQTGVWDLDLEGGSFYHSLEFDRIFGYQEGLSFWNYPMLLRQVLEADRPEVERHFRQALRTHGTWSFECRIKRPDSEVRWILFAGRYRSSSNYGKSRLAGIVQDITERKRAQAALRQSEERFRAFMANLPGLAYIKDEDGHYVYSSGANCAKIEAFASAETAVQSREEDWQVLQSGMPMTRILGLSTPKGIQHWLLTRFPIKTRNDSQPLLGAIAVDITERIEAEQKLASALKEEAVLKREIHHRVKNSLQVVISLLYIQSLHTTDPTLREILRECQSRTRAIALIYALLSSENMERIRVSGYLRQLATDLRIAYFGSTDRIGIKVQAEEIFVDVDTALPCGLILTELLSNSFKHAFPSERRGEIQIGLTRDEQGMVELTVRDNGAGPRPGVDLHTSQTVGLSLVRDLARQLGGEIRFEVGPGTMARVVWPERRLESGRLHTKG